MIGTKRVGRTPLPATEHRSPFGEVTRLLVGTERQLMRFACHPPESRTEDRGFSTARGAAHARVYQVTRKRPSFDRNVSHANNRTQRRCEPNLQHTRSWVDEAGLRRRLDAALLP
jgi:hypothetical protein